MNMVPDFTVEEAAGIARELYGVEAAASELPGERDQNFRLRDAGGAEYVLKIANAAEDWEVLELQNRAIEFLRSRETGLEWPRVAGNGIERVGAHYVRLLTWVPGVCLAQVRPHSDELLRSLGRALAATDLALAGFDHPAAHRTMHWDLKQAAMARGHLRLLTDGQRSLAEPFFDGLGAGGLERPAAQRDSQRRERLQRAGGCRRDAGGFTAGFRRHGPFGDGVRPGGGAGVRDARPARTRWRRRHR